MFEALCSAVEIAGRIIIFSFTIGDDEGTMTLVGGEVIVLQI